MFYQSLIAKKKSLISKQLRFTCRVGFFQVSWPTNVGLWAFMYNFVSFYLYFCGLLFTVIMGLFYYVVAYGQFFIKPFVNSNFLLYQPFVSLLLFHLFDHFIRCIPNSFDSRIPVLSVVLCCIPHIFAIFTSIKLYIFHWSSYICLHLPIMIWVVYMAIVSWLISTSNLNAFRLCPEISNRPFRKRDEYIRIRPCWCCFIFC